MRKILYSRPDGGLSVVHPVRNTLGETLTTDAEIEQRAWDKLPTDAINPQFIDAAVVPADRTFRNAWSHGGSTVNVDMGKAREIHKDKLRELRKPLLEALDVQFMRALELGQDTKAIVDKKQALRDVTSDAAISAAKTPDELKAAIPQILK